jgi:hypothetical protein
MDTVFGLKRKGFYPHSTLGELWLDGELLCNTLEDVVRPDGKKIDAETAIPAGEYQIIINYSERFQRPMPLLLNVPKFEGVRIHSGNTDKDTEGCILVGTKTDNPDFIEQSRMAFAKVFPMIESAMKTGKVYINITNEGELYVG